MPADTEQWGRCTSAYPPTRCAQTRSKSVGKAEQVLRQLLDERKWGMPSIECREPARPALQPDSVERRPPKSEITPSMSTISRGRLPFRRLHAVHRPGAHARTREGYLLNPACIRDRSRSKK